MTSTLQFIGGSAFLTLSDPWEIGESIGWKSLEVLIVKCGKRAKSVFGPEADAIIIKLEAPFSFAGVEYEYLQGSPRHEAVSFDSLLHGESVFCSFVRIPSAQVHSENPFDLSWWRGGGGVIGTLSLR